MWRTGGLLKYEQAYSWRLLRSSRIAGRYTADRRREDEACCAYILARHFLDMGWNATLGRGSGQAEAPLAVDTSPPTPRSHAASNRLHPHGADGQAHDREPGTRPASVHVRRQAPGRPGLVSVDLGPDKVTTVVRRSKCAQICAHDSVAIRTTLLVTRQMLGCSTAVRSGRGCC
jgi:hypothetical protein